MFGEGIDGFTDGLSAENYISIAKTSRAAATRDLQDLVEKGALTAQRSAARANVRAMLSVRRFEVLKRYSSGILCAAVRRCVSCLTDLRQSAAIRGTCGARD